MATVPAPRTWGASEQVTAAKLNADVRDSSNFLLATPRAYLRKSVTQSIGAGAVTGVTWGVEDYDTDNGHSNVTNPSRYTAQTAGWYHLVAAIYWPTALDAAHTREVSFLKNGSAAGRWGKNDLYIWGGFGSHCGQTAETHMQLNIGDFAEVGVFQSAAVARDIGVNGSRFSIRWVHS